ncbi:heparan-alpha-glucosaminide N-acetyltransferase domain-containing protein [Microbacterium sp. MC2]
MAAASAVTLGRGLSGPDRLQGVDLARGLAVLGMFAAHLLVIPALVITDPATWIDLANGRSSILFAVLAGVSIALVTGGARPRRTGLGTARRRIAVRALVLWVFGILLILTGVPVFVILPAYAVLFLLALPLVRLPARTLWITAAALGVVMPWVQPVLNALPLWEGEIGGALALAVGWHYPFPLWAAFLVAGLAAGRSDLRRPDTQWALLLAGGALALLTAAVDATFAAPADPYLAQVWASGAHSGGLLEVVGSGGLALATIAACQLLCRTPLRWVALPLRAVGSMPFTAYVGQLVAWAVIATALLGDPGDLTGMRALEPFWPFAVVTLIACTVWALLLGRGPLERFTAWVCRTLAPR